MRVGTTPGVGSFVPHAAQWGKGPSGEAPGRRRSGVGGSKAREKNFARVPERTIRPRER